MKNARQKSIMGESNKWLRTKGVESLLITDKNGAPEGVTKKKVELS